MLMKRVWGHVLAGASVVTGVVVAMAACKHNDSSLFVQDVLAGQPVSAGQVCKFTSDPTQPTISSGVLDIALASDYNATYLIGNQQVAEVNSQQLQTETSTITVQGAIVRITDAAGNQLNTFTRLSAATVYPSTGTVPGYAPITVTTIDSTTIQSNSGLQANVTAGGVTRLVTYVKFFGQTLGGNSIESEEFEFPVDVCMSGLFADGTYHSCLVSFSPTDESPLLPFPNCALAAATSSVSAPCVIGQDFGVDCSLCQGSAACEGAALGKTVVDAGGQ
jgi:hypothetical protein